VSNHFIGRDEMSRLQRFSLRNLPQPEGGKFSILADNLIERALKDLRERPHDKKARKVVLQLEFTPADSSDSDCREIDFRFVAKTSVPNYLAMPHRLILHADAKASFQPEEVTDEEA
jgi:hypothetical protein